MMEVEGLELEAPPGFEPGVEVLQTRSRVANLLIRFAFSSTLIPRFRPFLGGSVPTLFPRFGWRFTLVLFGNKTPAVD